MKRFCAGDIVQIINLDYEDAHNFPGYMEIDAEDAIGMTGFIKEGGCVFDGYVCIFNKEGEENISWWFDPKCLQIYKPFLRRERAQKATRVPMFPEEDPFS